jgi:hypothetical protein
MHPNVGISKSLRFVPSFGWQKLLVSSDMRCSFYHLQVALETRLLFLKRHFDEIDGFVLSEETVKEGKRPVATQDNT